MPLSLPPLSQVPATMLTTLKSLWRAYVVGPDLTAAQLSAAKDVVEASPARPTIHALTSPRLTEPHLLLPRRHFLQELLPVLHAREATAFESEPGREGAGASRGGRRRDWELKGCAAGCRAGSR